jgi:AMIN domain-containing protein
MLLLSCATAQDPTSAVVQNVAVAREGTDLRVEITLSSTVKPSVETAIHPDRILLDLPDTTCGDKPRKVHVNTNGVLVVRTAQHSLSPLVTRIVLDLDQAHPYTLRSEGNRIILTVAPAVNARTGRRNGAPVAATSGNLIGIFRRRQEAPAAITTVDNSAATTTPGPPPSVAAASVSESPHNSPESTLPAAPPSVAVSQSQSTSVPPQASAGQTSAGQAAHAQTQVVAVANASVNSAGVPVETASSATGPLSVTTTAASTTGIKTGDSGASSPGAEESVTPPIAPTSPAPASSTTSPPAGNAAMVITRTDDPGLRTVFKVKYVAEGVAYLEGGRAQGLTEGMKLEVEETGLPARQGESASAADPRVVAELEVSAVAETSAVTDIHSPTRPVKAGDLAYLSSGDTEMLVQKRALSPTRQYPAVISFTEGDTLDEEARQEVPRPPLPSVNRARGRIGMDYMNTISHGATNMTSSDVGMVFRGDITRIGGSYWNLSGYWRGRLTKTSAASQQTLQDLLNRTYHLNMTYDNPNSTLVAGFGRLYLPWAPSLDTIDGGYFGTQLSKGTTLGMFGGSTPDPSSWDYQPNRAIGGAFINFEGGEYNGFHYSSTAGAGVSMVKWQIDRPFVIFEDNLSYKRDIAIYESAQLDSPAGNSATPSPGPGLGRNFFTLRVNPHPRVELDFNYNYFRDVPTFDSTLVGTGLLDKFLFQGFSAGGRVEVWKQIWVSTNLGRASRSGDSKASLNEMFGLTLGRLPWLKLRADAHYARFNSSFGTGSYESVSLSRQMSDRLRLEVLIGQQNFASMVTNNNRARFVTGTVETTLGPHYYLQGSFTTNRGQLSYDQFMFSMGYRFDSKKHRE